MLNYATGEDDEIPLAGDVGEQAGAPFNPMPPSPAQAPGAEQPSLAPPPAPMAPPAAPAPSVLPAAVPQIAPYRPQQPPPIPVSRVVTPAEAANLGALDKNAAARQETAQDQGDVSAVGAAAKAQAADRQEFIADSFLKERNRIADEATKRIQERQAQANADYDAFKKFGIKDPEAEQGFGTRILKAIVVGLGQYSAGMNGGANTALNIIQAANKENIDRQKAQQEKLFQAAQKSGKDVGEAKQERDDTFRQLDLKHSALLESSAAMLRNELARLGVPQAQIDANKDVQAIEREALGIRERTLQSIRDDETSLAKADILAAARKSKGAKGAGGGAGSMDARAQLSEYAQANPGDTPGLYRLGAKLGLGQKDVNAAINQNKVTEGAGKEAGQGAVALRAIDAIEKSKYTPSREDVQKWMDNQRDVARAAAMSEGKGIMGAAGQGAAGLLQKKGLLAQNEFDGLSTKAREYFTNVRRYMETIGRVQSGAAISNSEWNNFYGQYGPQSSGGLEAARQFARDRFQMSGVAGRVLEKSSGNVPSRGGGAKPESDAVKQARQIVNDPAAAKRAAKESGLSETQVKAKATLYLRQNNAADIVL